MTLRWFHSSYVCACFMRRPFCCSTTFWYNEEKTGGSLPASVAAILRMSYMRSQSRPAVTEHSHLRWLTLDQPVIYCTSRCAALLRNQGDYGMLTVGRTPSERDSKGHSRSLELYLLVRLCFGLLCVVDCSAWTVHLIFILYYFLLAAAVYHGNNWRGDAKNRKCCSLRSCFHLFDFATKTTDQCNNQTNSPKTPTK